MEDMIYFQNMDVATELASLEFGIDFDEVNVLEGLTTPSPSDSLHFVSPGPNMPTEEHHLPEVESSLTESGHSQNTQLNDSNYRDSGADHPGGAPPSPTNTPVSIPSLSPYQVEEVAEAAGGDSQAQTTELISDKATSVAISKLPLVPLADDNTPNQQPPLPASPASLPVLNGTQPDHLSSPEGLVLQGTVSSVQAQELNYPNLLSSQNEDIHTLQDRGLPNGYSTNNQLLPQNVVANNAFSGIDHQTYPSYQENPAEAGAGVGTGILNQRPLTCSQGPERIWNSSWPQHHQFPAVNVYDSQYAPNYMQHDTSAIHRLQQFNTLPQQDSHVSGIQKIFDLQDCMQPVCPTYPRPEPYSNCQPMPPNSYDHQHVYRHMPPEPTVASRSAMYPDYHPQTSSFATTYHSFRPGSSMPLRYPQLHDYQRNLYNSQKMMPNEFGQQCPGSAQLSGSLRVTDKKNEHNQLWSTPSVQGQSSTVRGPTTLSRFTGSNASSRVVVAPSRHMTPNASKSSFLRSKAPEASRPSWTQKAQGIRLQKAASAATNTVAAQLHRGKLAYPSSSSRPQASEGVLKILNQNAKPTATSSAYRTSSNQIQTPNFEDPEETWIKKLEKELNWAWNQPESLSKMQEASSGRRPLKRPEIGESSSSCKRPKLPKDSASEEGDKTLPYSSENGEKEDEDANATNPSAARQFMNSVYDPYFETKGLPIDPHIRFFKGAET